jgi:exodeoxyribonuclease V alpha subunit
MAGDVLNNPTALFNVSAFKLKAICKITGQMFWENVHHYLNTVFTEMFAGKMFIPIKDLTAAERMLLPEMPVYVSNGTASINYAYSIYRDLRKNLRRLHKSRERFAEKVGHFDVPTRFDNDPIQREAFCRAIRETLLVIEGPAGTGKSELSLYIFNTLVQMDRRVSVGAFTGKASANLAKGRQRNILSMAAQRQFDPRTLHSLKQSKGTIETLLIDEVSMLNAELLTQMFREHPEINQLILIGDIAQLPPMGIGHLLVSLDKRSYSIELTKTYRFDGDLLDVATAIRRGKMPVESDNFKKMEGDATTVTALVKNFLELPDCGINDLAVVTYYNKTVDTINFAIQKILLRRGETTKGPRDQRKQRWNVGDRIIFLENNPDIRVWNGQEGRVQAIDPEDNAVIANFDGIEVKMATQWSDKDQRDDKEDEQLEKFEHTPVEDLTTRQIRLSYALTGYKAQGSQWKTVIVYLEKFGKSNKRINRNYLYTAITRAQESLFFIGTDFHLKRGISQTADFYPFPLEVGPEPKRESPRSDEE